MRRENRGKFSGRSGRYDLMQWYRDNTQRVSCNSIAYQQGFHIILLAHGFETLGRQTSSYQTVRL